MNIRMYTHVCRNGGSLEAIELAWGETNITAHPKLSGR